MFKDLEFEVFSELHEKLVQPVTLLKIFIELKEQGLDEPEDLKGIKEATHRLVEIVQTLRFSLECKNLTTEANLT